MSADEVPRPEVPLSEDFAGSGESIAVRLTGAYDAVAVVGVQEYLHANDSASRLKSSAIALAR